jgi:hypothetical protein
MRSTPRSRASRRVSKAGGRAGVAGAGRVGRADPRGDESAAGIQQHYREEIEKANAAPRRGLYNSEQEYQASSSCSRSSRSARSRRAGVGPDGRPSLLGMKPWQATNLMYQVNDVVSGWRWVRSRLADYRAAARSDHPAVPAPRQRHHGRVRQSVSPRRSGCFRRDRLGVKQAADQAERLRTFAGVLKATADGATYSARRSTTTSRRSSSITSAPTKRGDHPPRSSRTA